MRSSEVNPAALRRVRLLVVGDVMLDRYWFGDVNRISPEAPVPVVHVQKQEDRLGGAANVARNAAALGAQAGLLCVVGHDEPGERIVELLKDSGVVPHLERDRLADGGEYRECGNPLGDAVADHDLGRDIGRPEPERWHHCRLDRRVDV